MANTKGSRVEAMASYFRRQRAFRYTVPPHGWRSDRAAPKHILIYTAPSLITWRACRTAKNNGCEKCAAVSLCAAIQCLAEQQAGRAVHTDGNVSSRWMACVSCTRAARHLCNHAGSLPQMTGHRWSELNESLSARSLVRSS